MVEYKRTWMMKYHFPGVFFAHFSQFLGIVKSMLFFYCSFTSKVIIINK